VDLELKAGEWVALIGGNGSGKSTLLQSLAALLPLMKGQIRLDGQDLRSLLPRDRARHMAVLLTGMPMATGMPVDDFLALGRYPHRDWLGQDSDGPARMNRIRALLDLQAFGRRPFHTLSDGERQRVLLGRALVQDAPLLLLDEPTHHLDPAQTARIQDLLGQWRRQEAERSVVVATHDLAWAFGSADRLGVLQDGQVHWGTPAYWRERPQRLVQAYEGEGLRLDTAQWRFVAH
jgi:iron complex transport system ATP-binding protein